MRTTVNLHVGLLATAKQHAHDRGKTLGDVLEEALQRYLLEAGQQAEVAADAPLPVFRGGSGLAPGIDAASNISLYEAMHADEDAAMAALMRRDERP